jgi:hypothetical protein
MRAFEVSLNGKKLCSAGIGDDGVLTAIVNWVTGKSGADLFLHVGGLIGPTGEHVAWENNKRLRLNDRIEVKVIETRKVDEPKRRKRPNPAKDLRARKRYVREMAKQFGWKIMPRPKPTTDDQRPTTIYNSPAPLS